MPICLCTNFSVLIGCQSDSWLHPAPSLCARLGRTERMRCPDPNRVSLWGWLGTAPGPPGAFAVTRKETLVQQGVLGGLGSSTLQTIAFPLCWSWAGGLKYLVVSRHVWDRCSFYLVPLLLSLIYIFICVWDMYSCPSHPLVLLSRAGTTESPHHCISPALYGAWHREGADWLGQVNKWIQSRCTRIQKCWV